MPARIRDLSPYSSLGARRYSNIESFLSRPITNGVSSIKGDNRWFDLLYEDRKAEVTLVVFHAAVPDSRETYPFFSSQKMAAELDVNYLCFSDPAVGSNERLPTYWYLNTRRVQTQKMVLAATAHALATGSGGKLLFFGSSAGGFAALNNSAHFPGSTALVMNPRIDLMARPDRFSEYSAVTYPGWDAERVARRLPSNVSKMYVTPPGNRVIYLQNSQDKNYYRHHYSQFHAVVKGRDDVQFVVEEWGNGHVVPPRSAYMTRLKGLVDSMAANQ